MYGLELGCSVRRTEAGHTAWLPAQLVRFELLTAATSRSGLQPFVLRLQDAERDDAADDCERSQHAGANYCTEQLHARTTCTLWSI